MAKKKDEQVAETVAYDETTVLAHIVKDEDGYHVVDVETGETGPSCKFCDANDKTIVLTPNRANRKWANRAKADEAIEKDGFFPLTYKASKHFGPTGTKMPNEKLIKFLPEDLQHEYRAIIDRAIAAREAAKSKPLTELEKAQAKLKRAQEAYAKLMAQASDAQ